MKHLSLLKANHIDNTSTAVYGWIDKMPADQQESNWLKKTFDGLYQIEQNFVLDTDTNDDKETLEVMQKAVATANAWVAKIIAIHDREEPSEQEEILEPIPSPKLEIPVEQVKEEAKKEQEKKQDQASSLAEKLQDYLAGQSSKKIAKRKLMEMGYQGPYPSAIATIPIETQFKLKREKRTSSLSFILSKD